MQMSDYILRKSIRPLPGKVIKAVPLPKPDIRVGLGAHGEVGEICRKRGFKRALVVTDTTISALALAGKLEQSLEGAGIQYATFAEICGEPTSDMIEKGRKAALNFGADCIVGLGGGSVMDSCKMIAAGARLPALPVRKLLLKFLLVPDRTLPIINIPSTAGTGAEMTVGAVITDSRRNRKKSTVIIGLNVTDVLLDSELTLKMPRSITAACGIDALSHGMEGIVAGVSCSEEDYWKSLECVRLVLENLPLVLANPEDEQARSRMCIAANYGGNAINCQLAGYVHAFAHSIGARYHIPHGNAIASCLLPVLEAEMPHCIAKMALAARHCGLPVQHSDSAEQGIELAAKSLMKAIYDLIDLCGFPVMPPIPEADFDTLVRLINADSINYSAPVTLTDSQIKEILRKI